jgi:glycosyltransferase involved in cell wall biosynthesis
MDLSLLENDEVFCLNRISLLFERVSWRPRFFTAFDLRVVPDNLDEFNGLDIEYKFFATKHKGAILEKSAHYWYHDWGHSDFADRFSGNPAVTGFGGGGTVTVAAIQLAAYLGFDPIILVGCDASYTVPESAVQSGPDKFGDGVKLNLESTDDDDENHFDPAYFGKGKRWHSPNAAEMLVGFEKCYRQMRAQGLTLVNATVGGALDAVPRVAYANLFDASGPNPATVAVGIDLTHEMAAKTTGMRHSLMTTLQNTTLFSAPVRFVALCTDDDRLEYFGALRDQANFDVLTTTDPTFDERVAALDAVVLPFNDLATSLPLRPDTRTIAYLNDLIPVNQPGFPDFLRKRYLATAAGADAILCLSEPTKSDIVRVLDVAPERCFVAPPAIDDDLTVVPVNPDYLVSSQLAIDAAKRKVGLKFTYLLYPAAFRPHKNHRRLFEAMRYTYTNLQLVLTTGESHDEAAEHRIRELIAEMKLQHRILVAGRLDTVDYRALLAGAEAVVFPSLEEGFGIPVAEAQAMRVPVIASRRASLSDVAQGSLEIDPEDPRDIAEKITQLTSDEELRRQVADEGWANSRRFTKDLGAAGLLDAIAFVMTDQVASP